MTSCDDSAVHLEQEFSPVNLSCTWAGYVNYEVESDWYWIYSLLEITTMTDHSHWEHLSTGNSLNPYCELVLRFVSLNSPRALTGTD
jgi:hypothetical protein